MDDADYGIMVLAGPTQHITHLACCAIMTQAFSMLVARCVCRKRAEKASGDESTTSGAATPVDTSRIPRYTVTFCDLEVTR